MLIMYSAIFYVVLFTHKLDIVCAVMYKLEFKGADESFVKYELWLETIEISSLCYVLILIMPPQFFPFVRLKSLLFGDWLTPVIWERGYNSKSIIFFCRIEMSTVE